MGLEVRVFRMCDCMTSIPLFTSVSVAEIRTSSDHKWRPNSKNVRNGKLQLAMCSFKPTTRDSENQDLLGELGFKEKLDVNSTEKSGREIVELKEEKSEKEEAFGVGSSEKVKLRRGKQVMRRSNLLAKQVISIQSAISLGFISQLWVDTTSVSLIFAKELSNVSVQVSFLYNPFVNFSFFFLIFSGQCW